MRYWEFIKIDADWEQILPIACSIILVGIPLQVLMFIELDTTQLKNIQVLQNWQK